VPTVMEKASVRDPLPAIGLSTNPAHGSHGAQVRLPLSVPERPAGRGHSDATAFHAAWQERAQQQPLTADDPFDDAGSFAGDIKLSPAQSTLLDKESAHDYLPLAPSEDAPAHEDVPDAATGADYRNQDARAVRVLAQTRNQYILAQTSSALLLIDQHIAHERVLYEKLLAGAEGGGAGVPTQRLMLPFTLETSRREALVIEQRLEDLARAGFEMESFGGDSFVVRSVPASVAQKSIKAQGGPEATLRAIIDELVEKTVSRRLLLPAEEVLITASCKMAVKAGDPLSFDEMEALVADLFRSDNPYTCPHGRPIIIEFPNTDLDRKFGR